jgi:AraC-like DNA-binding protein
MAATLRTRPAGMVPVRFHPAKYGSELLVDVAWIRDIPTFILDDPHALNFYDITLVTRGRGTVSLDGFRYPVRPGALLFTSPGQVRQWQVTKLDGICVFFPELFLAEFFNDPDFLARLPYFHAPEGSAALELASRPAGAIRRQLGEMQRELGRLRDDSVHLLRASLYETLIKLARHYSVAHGERPGHVPHPVTTGYLALVERHATQHRAVSWYAGELAVSPGYLNTLCQRHTGVSAKTVMANQLVLEARRRLLYSPLTAEQIASALGFADPSYFARFFRARTGKSPREFRAVASGDRRRD